MDVFVPTAATVSLTASATSQNVQIPLPTVNTFRPDVRIRNTSTSEIFVRFDATAPTAVASTDIPIAPNSVEVLGIPDLPNAAPNAPYRTLYVAVIAGGAASGPIYFTAGEGM